MSKYKPYTESFYQSQQQGSLRSAEIIVPLLINLINPKSIIDIGCGVGTWLSVFKKMGVEDILGVDGEWVNRRMLKIPDNCFLTHDMTQPLQLSRKFELVMSLEVAEHLPKEYAELFIDSLTRLAPVVLFSAAIPFQGGANHVNEQWPDYWAALFKAKEYEVIDCIRKHIWDNDKIKYWYAQNTLIFSNIEYIKSNTLLLNEFNNTSKKMLSLVHPQHYLLAYNNMNMTLGQVFQALPSIVRRSFSFRLNVLLNRLLNK